MDSLFYYQKSKSSPISPIFTGSIRTWEEEFKSGFENIFNTQDDFFKKKEEYNITNEIEKIYLINDESSSTENINSYFNTIKENISQKNNLNDIEIVKYLMKLENFYEKNNNKDTKIKNLILQKELLNILKERTNKKIENINNNSSNNNTNSNQLTNQNTNNEIKNYSSSNSNIEL